MRQHIYVHRAKAERLGQLVRPGLKQCVRVPVPHDGNDLCIAELWVTVQEVQAQISKQLLAHLEGSLPPILQGCVQLRRGLATTAGNRLEEDGKSTLVDV